MNKAYFTLATSDYLPGAVCLVKSLKKHSKIPIVVMSVDLSIDEKHHLKDLGAGVIEAPKITSKLVKVLPFHKDENFCQNCFCKLNMWNTTEYDKIVYLDSDTVVLKNTDCMFETDSDFSACRSLNVEINIDEFKKHPSFKKSASLKDIPRKFIKTNYKNDYFNAGVLILKPNKEDYKKMMSLKDAIVPNNSNGDQGFLNNYFKGRWHPMDHKFNYSRRHFEMWPEKFEKDKEDIHVLHFTGADNNPWSKEPENEMERIWWSNFDC